MIALDRAAVQARPHNLADASAVVFVEQAEIERVLDAAENIMAREEAMAQALRAGTPISQVMGANYQHEIQMPTECRGN